MTIKISPFSFAGILIGFLIQTIFYGWNMPVTFINILLVIFHVFILPTVGCFLILFIIGTLLSVIGELLSNGKA